MAKNSLEAAISEAASKFALEIVEAVKKASLQELIELQKGEAPKRRGRKPGPKPKKKPGPKPKKKPGPKPKGKPGRKPGRPKKVVEAKEEKATRKKRVVKNYPKCAFPSCNKNRFVRGKGFCGDHWKQWKDGKIKSAEEYKK